MLALEDEARPRDGTAADVCQDDGPKSSPLQMGCLELLVQEDAMAGPAETIAKLNILDGGRWKRPRMDILGAAALAAVCGWSAVPPAIPSIGGEP
jgi:hypothetical protein